MLLGFGHHPAVEVIGRDRRGAALVLCDHASNRVPPALALGVDPVDMNRHIAWDIGAQVMALRLGEILDATVVVSGYSRLVIDLNRPPGDLASIRTHSDGTVIPGNVNLDQEQVRARELAFYEPYHAAVQEEIGRISTDGRIPALIMVHSFTPKMNGCKRPWELGVLWDWDPRMAIPLIAWFVREGDIFVGDNQPYSGRDKIGHTADIHALRSGLPNVLTEVRQDLCQDDASAAAWAERLAVPLSQILADSNLSERRLYGPPGQL